MCAIHAAWTHRWPRGLRVPARGHAWARPILHPDDTHYVAQRGVNAVTKAKAKAGGQKTAKAAYEAAVRTLKRAAEPGAPAAAIAAARALLEPYALKLPDRTVGALKRPVQAVTEEPVEPEAEELSLRERAAASVAALETKAAAEVAAAKAAAVASRAEATELLSVAERQALKQKRAESARERLGDPPRPQDVSGRGRWQFDRDRPWERYERAMKPFSAADEAVADARQEADDARSRA